MIYAVGDIHGHYDRLTGLIGQLPLREDDNLVFVGDYTDRGPATRQVIQFLIDLQASQGNCIFLRGNHEQMMLDAREAFKNRSKDAPERLGLWLTNGGAEALESYEFNRSWTDRVLAEHWRFLETTILEYWRGPFVFVHAGLLPPGSKWSFAEDPRLWIREDFLSSLHDFGARVIFGHTPQRSGRPLEMINKLGIDTGAAYGGPLTAVGLDINNPESFEIFQA